MRESAELVGIENAGLEKTPGQNCRFLISAGGVGFILNIS